MKRIFCVTASVFMLVAVLVSLSACAKDGADRQAGPGAENMVREYAAESFTVPGELGMALQFSVLDTSVYVLGDGSGQYAIASCDLNSGSWKGLLWDEPDCQVKDISAYGDSLWLLLQMGGGGYSLCRLVGEDFGEAVELDIQSEGSLKMHMCSDGLLLWDYSRLCLLDPGTGNALKEKQLNSGWTLNGISAAKDVTYAQVNKNNENYLIEINKLFSGSEEAVKYGGWAALVPLCRSEREACLVGELESLMCYDHSAQSYSRLFSWADMGCTMPDLIPSLAEGSDGTIFFLDRASGKLMRVTSQLVPERTVITLATAINSSLLSDMVYNFNQENELYKVELKMYQLHDADRLRTEIIAGNGPDIIDSFSLPIAGEATGYFEDLLPYLEADEELSPEDLAGSIFEAAKSGDSLYYIMPGFDIHTAVTPEALGPGLSFEAYMEGLSKPEGGMSLELGPSDVFQEAFPVIERDIITLTGGEPVLDRELLGHWLSFCQSAQGMDLSFATISNCRKAGALPLNYGGELNYIGLPGQKGGGSYISPAGLCFSMLSTSRHKEAAWDLIRQALLPACQDKLAPFGFPVVANSLDAVIESAVEDDETAFTEADAEKLKELLKSIDIVFYQDRGLKALMAQDLDSFFAGQYSLDEALDLIQSKANIYLAEQYGP